MHSVSYPATFRRDPGGRGSLDFRIFRRLTRTGNPAQSRLKRGQRLVPVPLWIAGKLALYLTMIEQGVTNSELARRLGVRETVIRRMLDPDHDTRSEKIQAALEALGKRIVIAIDDAA
jgi:antitoxin HicB